MGEEVHKIAEYIFSRSPGKTSGPLDRSLYKDVGFWQQSQWQLIRNSVKAKDLSVESPIISLYMEDEFSNLISAGKKTCPSWQSHILLE
jgi:hypothetical protein